MSPFAKATIGTPRDDGDFAILATVNNVDERIPNDEFTALVCALAMRLAAATGEPVRVYEREDTPDYIDLEDEDRLIMDGIDTQQQAGAE